MGTRIKHCSLMMNLARPFEIQNGVDFSLSHSEDVNYQTKGAMVRPYIVVDVEGFALCKDGLHPFHSSYAVSRPPFSSRYLSYSWFKQFERTSSGDLVILQFPLGDVLNTP